MSLGSAPFDAHKNNVVIASARDWNGKKNGPIS